MRSPKSSGWPPRLGAAVLLAAAGALPADALAAPAELAEPSADTVVRAVLADVSAQRIKARIERLAAFGTRHTMSDTASETRGIGAARRWIKQEFEACAKASGGRMKVEFDAYTEPPGRRIARPTEVVNVVATLEGAAPAGKNRLYVVSGHYDSRASDVMDATSDAPGANDDASGTAAVIELACAMAKHRFSATLVFMAVAGEEQGLLGASHWAEMAARQQWQVAGMITNDIVGSPVGEDGRRRDQELRLFADGLSPLLRLVLNAQKNQPGDTATTAETAKRELEAIAGSGGEDDTPTHQLGRYLKETAERYLPGFKVNLIARKDRFLRGGDHLPFLERGFPAVRFTEPAENFRHQHQNVRDEDGVRYGDLPEFVDGDYVAMVARVNGAGLASLALAPAPPQGVGIEVVDLTNDTTLRWLPANDPGLAGYRIVWREVSSPVWQHQRDVGKVARYTLSGVSKDDYLFGVQAVGRNGAVSTAVFPRPWRP